MKRLLHEIFSHRIFTCSLLSWILLWSPAVYADLDKEYQVQASDQIPSNPLCNERWTTAQVYKDSMTRYQVVVNTDGLFVHQVINNSRGCYVMDTFPYFANFSAGGGNRVDFISCEKNDLIRYSKLYNDIIIRDKIGVFANDYCG